MKIDPVHQRLHLLCLAVIVFGSLQLSERTRHVGPEITRDNGAAYHELLHEIPAGASLACMNVGILGYQRRPAPVYDLQALTNPDLAPALAARNLDAMLRAKCPDYVLIELQHGAAGEMTKMFQASVLLADTNHYRPIAVRRVPRDLLILMRRTSSPIPSLLPPPAGEGR